MLSFGEGGERNSDMLFWSSLWRSNLDWLRYGHKTDKEKEGEKSISSHCFFRASACVRVVSCVCLGACKHWGGEGGGIFVPFSMSVLWLFFRFVAFCCRGRVRGGLFWGERLSKREGYHRFLGDLFRS